MIAHRRHPQTRRSARHGQRPSENVRRLRHVDLRLKLDDLLDLLPRGRGAGLLVSHDRAHRLRLERRFTSIGHEIHADRLAGFRIDIGQHAGLQHDRRAAGNNVFQIRRHAGTPIDGNRRLGALETVLAAGIASGRVAHHLDRELDRLRRAVGISRRPGERNPEKPALEQERMRAFLLLRQVRTVRAVERREDRVLAIGRVPAVGQAGGRYAHSPRWLMTSDAGAPVRSQRL